MANVLIWQRNHRTTGNAVDGVRPITHFTSNSMLNSAKNRVLAQELAPNVPTEVH
jgi:hypothetical protein